MPAQLVLDFHFLYQNEKIGLDTNFAHRAIYSEIQERMNSYLVIKCSTFVGGVWMCLLFIEGSNDEHHRLQPVVKNPALPYR